ncbi:hypothetical protein GBAR_LOCUS13936, partial [Geodia barretti]
MYDFFFRLKHLLVPGRPARRNSRDSEMATSSDGEAVIRTGAKRKRQELQGEGKQEGHKKFKGEGNQVWTW